MNFDIDGARKAGYSDQEITEHLKSSGAKFDFDGARGAGYSDTEIVENFRAPATPEAPQRERKSGMGMDALLNAGASVNRALGSVSDLAGADNSVSQFFRGNVDTLESQLSQDSADTAAKNATEMQAAEGFGAKFVTGAKQAVESPVQTGAKTLGYLAPTIATGAAGAVAGLGRIGLTALNVVMGALQGGGAVKGGIYDAVKEAPEEVLLSDPRYAELRETFPEAQAKEALAVLRQSYGESGGKIALGAAAGGVTGVIGAESALIAGMTKAQAKAALAKEAALKNIPLVAAKEAATEVPQEMLETGLVNLGAGGGGAAIDPMSGVAEAGGAAAVSGAFGGGFGGGLQVQAARSRLPGAKGSDAVDATTVLDSEAPAAAPLALPAPRIIVNERGQAVQEGSGRVFDEAPAKVVGRVEPVVTREAMGAELQALGLNPTPRATPTPISVGSDGTAVTDPQTELVRAAQADAASVDPQANVVGRAPIEIDPITQLPYEAGQRATPTPIRVDGEGQAVTDAQTTPAAPQVPMDAPANVVGRAPIELNPLTGLPYEQGQRATATPIRVDGAGQAMTDAQTAAPAAPDTSVDPQANVVGRADVQGALGKEISALGVDPTQRASATPIRVDGEGAAALDGDTRTAAQAEEAGLDAQARTLYPKSPSKQAEWKDAERERRAGYDGRMRALAAVSNDKKKARGVPVNTQRQAPARDTTPTAETGVVRKSNGDGTVSYFFATQPEAALVVRQSDKLDAREVVSISEQGQGALVRAALADGPLQASTKTLSRNTLKDVPGVATDRNGVTRLIGREETRAKIAAELNRQAADAALAAADKKITDPDEMEVASRAVMNDPRAAASAMRKTDPGQMMDALRKIAGVESQAAVDSTDEQTQTPGADDGAQDDEPAVRRSSGAPRAGAGRPDGQRDGRDSRSGQADGSQGQLTRPTYGEPTEGSVEVDAVHYSKGERTTLSSSMSGTNYPGAEVQRLERSSDPRIKQRIYFYVDKGQGISPEGGVGGKPHVVTLQNVYDRDTDTQRIFRDAPNLNAAESAVIDAGFDGYMTREFNASGAVVLLGRHAVPVVPTQAKTPNPGGRVVPPAQRQNSPLDELGSSTMVPMGAIDGPRWRAILSAVMPKLVDLYNDSKAWAISRSMYRDELARELGKDQPSQGQQNETDSQPEVRRSGGQPAAVRPERTGDGAGRDQGRGTAPLEGAPNVVGASGPDPRLVSVAEKYAQDNGIDLKRQAIYVEVDPAFAKRIAEAYEAMEHSPQDPAVKEAYRSLIEQTRAQYDALIEAGYTFTFFDSKSDPYGGNPWNAMRDLRANQTMAVYGTYDGYGTEGITDSATEGNPMLADTGLQWADQSGVMHPVTANDLFRAVHDAFGHGVEGSGFRARGEENAWQVHSRLFTGPALGAITSETRGQNSWLNYGPYGEANQTAKLEDTVFAEQKTGLMPEWTWTENVEGDRPSVMRSRARSTTKMAEPDDMFGEEVGDRGSMVMNWIIQAPTDARKALGLPSFREAKSITKRAFADAVDKYRRGKIRAGDNSKRAVERLATALADEVEWYTKYSKDSGIDWYGVKFQRAIDELAKSEPSLKEPANRGLFTALLAITSDGTEVQENLGHAMSMYLAYQGGAKLADSTPGQGKYESSYQKNAGFLDAMIEDLGLQGTLDFLREPMFVIDVKEEMKMLGEKSPANDYPDDAVLPRAAAYLGPKLGAFYANLMGDTSYLTMDRWWNRTINRYRGIMAADVTDSSLEQFRELTGSDLSDDKLFELAQNMAKERQRKYEAGIASGQRYNATKAETIATTIDKNARTELNDSPLGRADRAFQIAVVNRAKEALRERGIEADIAGIQATIWYYEKELFEAIGVKGRGRISYEEAARNWVGKRGQPAASADRRDAAGKAGGAGASRPQENLDLFSEDPAVRRRAREEGLKRELGDLGAPTGARTQQGLLDRFKAELERDAKRAVSISLLEAKSGSKWDTLSREVKQRLDVDVVFFDSYDEAVSTGASVRSIPNTVFLNVRAVRPEFVVGHELLHELRTAYPDLYDTLVAKLRERAQDTLANADNIRGSYSDGGFDGAKVSDSLIEEENMADVAGIAFADPEFWAEVEAAMNPSKLKQLFRWLARWFGSKFNDKRDLGKQSGIDAAAADMREDIAAAYAEMGRRNGSVRSLAADVQFTVKRSNDGLRKTFKSIKDGMQASLQYGELLARQHEWAFQIGDMLFSTQTKKTYTLVARSFRPVGPIKNNDWQAVYRYEADGGDEQGSFPEKALLASKTMKSLTRPFTKRSGDAKKPRIEVTATPEFKRWFGASKVVDADGAPMVVYHGTLRDFDTFDPTASRFGNRGLYFAQDPQYASAFARSGRGQADGSPSVMPVYLSIKNPLVLGEGRFDPSSLKGRVAAALSPSRVAAVLEADRLRDSLGAGSLLSDRDVAALRAAGYDGVFDGAGAFIALSPTQVKSATGNDGSFDPTDPDIRRKGRERPVEGWVKPERSTAARVADTAVLGASGLVSPVTATMQAVNTMVDTIGQTIAKVTGVQRLGQSTVDMIVKAVDAKSSWGWAERVKQGLVADFGLPEEYLGQKVEKQARENKLLRQATSLLDRMSGMSPDQLAVAYQWLQEKPNTARETELMAKLPEAQREVIRQVKNDVDKLSLEALALGLITQEVYDRNKMAYIHRSYKKYEMELTDSQLLVRSRAQRLKGDQFKGRGMELEASLDRIAGNLPEELKGMMVEMLEKRDAAGKLVRREYLVKGTARPAALRDYTSAGTWEVRDATKGGKLKVWRDFTLEERQRMGEIEDARYGFARTMLQGVRDVETARFLGWVGKTYGLKAAAGLEVVELQPLKQALGTQTFTRDEWVKVPETKIKDTSVNRFGELAGMYVPGVMWNDIMALGDFQNTAWDKLLSFWKVSKTALSPAVHVNNVMSNFIMADLADIGVNDIRKALNLLVQSKRGDARARSLIERYQDSGAEAGSFAANEMKTEVLEPLLKQIAESEPEAVQRASFAQVISLAAHGQIGEAAVAATRTLPARLGLGAMDAMISAYQSEDSVFRLAKFVQELDAGKSDVEAGKAAKEAFLDYNINAPWIRAARRSVLPFVSFTYRAVPLIAKAMATKPWKFAKYYALGQGLAMLAYGMLGDQGDEEREQKLLPEDRSGTSILALPKMIRMPWNDKDGDPMWLDVRRWLPGADIVDTGNSRAAIPLPSWLSIGGPLSFVLDFYSNTNWVGDKIVSETDSAGQTIEKVADMTMKFLLPNLPLPGLGAALRVVGVPVDQGNLDPYAWASLERTAKGARSITGKTEEMSTTLPNVLGVKLDSRRLAEEVITLGYDYQTQEREIKTNLRRIASQGARGRIGETETRRRMDAEIAKLTELAQKTGERLKK